ncbi:MAG: hypothetical protein MI921_17115 [Cytophagales bacterium]|nr:hypothetical protein [Cytophagales bacterium]
MKFSIHCILTLFLVSSYQAFSQDRKFEVDTAFSTQVVEMMNRTKIPTAQEVGAGFKELWNGNTFSQDQKKKIMEIASDLYDKGVPVRPHFENLFASLVYAVNKENLSGQSLSKLLEISHKTVEQYDSKEIKNLFSTLRTIFNHGALYYSSFNKLYFENASYQFDFIESAVEEVIPEETEIKDEAEDSEDWFSDWDEEEGNDDWDTNWDNQEEVEEPGPEQLLLAGAPQPALEGPVITFESIDMIFVTSFDSTALVNSSGSLMLKDYTFVGSGGKFDWSVAGLGPDSVYCNFDKYNFDVTKPKLSAENVKMSYVGKLDKVVEGVFDFESRRHERKEKAKFPRFKSYENNVKVKLANNDELVYKGGFSLEGQKISSSSLYAGPASIEVSKNGQRKFRSKAFRYFMSDSLVEADIASVVIYQNGDSITHPAIRIKYNFLNNHLVVLKDQGRYKYAPFFASYFNMDVTADMIKWDLNSDSLDISILNARSQISAYFESREYFNPDRFGEMAGIYKFHPLFLVIGYSRKINSSEFNVEDLIRFSKQPGNVVRSAMEFLMSYHFIDYSVGSGDIKVRRKAYHNVLSKNRRKDYDNLLIASKLTNKPNATYRFEDREMTVRGVDKFYISEMLDVYIIPENKEVRLMKNRDFVFDGQLFVGNFEYIGRNFTFKYDSFLVDMQTIDSVRFYIQEQDEIGGEKSKLDNKLVGQDSLDVQNAMANSNMNQTSGTLLINKPNNKSARRVYPGYPSFSATNGAIVYFDGEEILGGAYRDMSVYFVIPPFKMDSLSGSDVRSVGFEGTFVTSGVLPDFQEKLKIMPDNSLGFEHQVPIEGYEIKGNKGKFFKKLTLDQNGLRGNGRIEYLSSTLESEDFVFYVDSIVTQGSKMTMENQTIGVADFPDAYVENYKMKWIPDKDSMYVHNIDQPVQLYQSTASLNGFMNITPQGVLGGGQLLTRGSEAISDELAFTSNYYSARHAKFEIKSSNPEKPALSGDDIRLHFDLINNIADVSPEIEGVAAINFPYAQMKTSITNAKWNLEDRSVNMEKPEEVDINSSYFYSTREELDSLAFNGSAATYDINELKLHVTGIPFIKVADAKITPENNELTVLENSELQPLENATLVIDTLNGYHNLSDGHITIISRNEFVGDATYDLVAAADTFGIKFNSFELESVGEGKKKEKLQTVSRGTIEEADKILVSPRMIFKGTATMYATNQALELEGFVKLDLKKMSGYDTWIAYKSISDTQQVIINYDQIVTSDGTDPSSGLHFDAGDYGLYTTFVNERKSLGDEDFFIPRGMLLFDEKANAFKIEETAKSSGQSFSGRSFTYDEENSKVTFEGPLQFLSPNTTQVKLLAAGKGEGNIETNEFNLNAFLVFDYNLPAPAMSSMALDIQDLIERLGIPEAHEDKTKLLYKASEIIGERAASLYDDKTEEDYAALVSVSNELAKALAISDIDLVWSETDKAFYNPLDSKIGISNIFRDDINAMVDGFVEIRKTENGEVVNVFLKISSSWYYLGFSDNRLVLYSNNDEFNDIIKNKTNVAKAKIGEYVFILGEMNEVQNFVDEFRKVYYDIDEPFELDRPTEVVIDDKPPTELTPEETTEEVEDDDEGF